MTTGTPPIRSMSTMWNLPCGLVSARCGTRAAIRLKSSSSRSTRASLAMARRCSTALVEPPSAMTTAMAFSNASLVMIWRGRMLGSSRLDHRLTRRVGEVVAPPVDRRRRRAAGQRHADRLGHRRHRVGGEHPGTRALGRAGVVLDQATARRRSARRPRARRPPRTRSRCRAPGRPGDRAGSSRRRGRRSGRLSRAAAISMPGSDLSQPAKVDEGVEALGVHHRSRPSRR